MGKDWRILPSDHRGNDTALTVSRDSCRDSALGRLSSRRVTASGCYGQGRARGTPNRAPPASHARKDLEAFGSAFRAMPNRCIERSRSRLLLARDRHHGDGLGSQGSPAR